MSRVTQKSIATKLGLSPSLVSRALAGRAGDIGVLPETIARIEQTARDMGYVPSAAATQLKGTGDPVLGIAAADMEDPFFGNVLAEIIRCSHEHHYALTLTGFERRNVDQRDVDVLLKQDLAALIVVGSGPMGWIEPVIRRHIPIIRIGSGPAPDAVAQYEPDEEQGFRELLEHLSTLGHRRAGFIGADLDVHRNRQSMVSRILENDRNGFRLDRIVLAHASGIEAGREGARRMMDDGDVPGAVICSSDAVAFGVMKTFAEAGLDVPGRVSVTGFDDLPMAGVYSPALTTLRQPINDMARVAVEMAGKLRTFRTRVRMPVKLMVRESTGPAPKEA